MLVYSISSFFEEEIEDTKSAIRIRKSKKNRVAKRKRTNNNLQNIHIKTKDRETRTTLKVGVNSGAPEGSVVPAPPVALIVLI